MGPDHFSPLTPANAGAQIVCLALGGIGCDLLLAERFVIWVPAFAGMSGKG
jgi:hypothetical protein